ncbi:LRR receptor-like serine/threonine-protein kinase GHR1 [Aristolochia californica]|uniref:LRR receptor-like serine/threonine-protein kinase GHR1 n=1 Tax=Aristolochia californica TaxID=171875 RepID=UPI0035D5F95A
MGCSLLPNTEEALSVPSDTSSVGFDFRPPLLTLLLNLTLSLSRATNNAIPKNLGTMVHGSLPGLPSQLLQLNYLHLSCNDFTTRIPSQFDILPNLEVLDLHQGQLSNIRFAGTLITGGGHSSFGTLKVVDLSNNEPSGELLEFDFFSTFTVLRLSNTKFSGFIPNGLLTHDSLVLLTLYYGND